VKLALTGATGFLGSHLAEALRRGGHEVKLLVRSRDKARCILERRGVWPLETVIGDMADADAVAALLDGCDAAVHAAAAFYGDDAVLRANVAGARNVLGIGADKGLAPLVYISTIATMFPPPGDIITVDDPIVYPKTTYGQSKAEGERIARQLQASGAPVIIIYPGGIMGPDDPGPTENTKGLRDRMRFAWLRTTGGLPLVDVRDLAAIVVAACERGAAPRRYMAGGHFLPWMEEADICEELTGYKVRRIPAPPAAVRAIGRCVDFARWLVPSFDYPLTSEAAEFVTQTKPCDSSRTLAELGIEFRPARETLRDTLRWLYEVGELDARLAGKLVEG
jgi:nucleoside-diphosphate-sugar epimerase